MEYLTNEKFLETFEDVILPIADLVLEEDYLWAKNNGDEEVRGEFLEFRGAFQQRLKLFYFRKFLEYKQKGQEKLFPGDTEHVQKDIYFMHEEFKEFLRDQRKRMGVGMGFLER